MADSNMSNRNKIKYAGEPTISKHQEVKNMRYLSSFLSEAYKILTGMAGRLLTVTGGSGATNSDFFLVMNFSTEYSSPLGPDKMRDYVAFKEMSYILNRFTPYSVECDLS
jgi:hypothetical protein